MRTPRSSRTPSSVGCGTRAIVPPDVRFQVSIPTPFAVVVAWANPRLAVDTCGSRSRTPCSRRSGRSRPRSRPTTSPSSGTSPSRSASSRACSRRSRSSARSSGSSTSSSTRWRSSSRRPSAVCTSATATTSIATSSRRRTSSLLVRLTNAVADRIAFDFVHMPVDREHGTTSALLRRAAPISRSATPSWRSGVDRLRERQRAHRRARRGGGLGAAPVRRGDRVRHGPSRRARRGGHARGPARAARARRRRRALTRRWPGRTDGAGVSSAACPDPESQPCEVLP